MPMTAHNPSHRAISLLIGLTTALMAVAAIGEDSTPPALRALQSNSYTDRIYLTNGDRITGNIKVLDRGQLRVNTRTMDTVYLNWEDVDSIETNKYMRISRTDGSFDYGQVQRADRPRTLVVLEATDSVAIANHDIASIRPIRINESLFARLEGEIKGGFDYTKGSDIFVLNVASNIRLREEQYEIGVNFSWNQTARSENNDSARALLAIDYTRLLRDRWFWQGSSSFEHNNELGLDLRTLVGGSAGRYLLQTNHQRFQVNAGLAASNEHRNGASTQTSLEGMLRTSYDIFIYHIPKTRLSAGLNLFPGITEQGRLRGNATISLRNEIIEDLFWDLSFYTSYDNQPPEGAANSDYGIITSVGVSF